MISKGSINSLWIYVKFPIKFHKLWQSKRQCSFNIMCFPGVPGDWEKGYLNTQHTNSQFLKGLENPIDYNFYSPDNYIALSSELSVLWNTVKIRTIPEVLTFGNTLGGFLVVKNKIWLGEHNFVFNWMGWEELRGNEDIKHPKMLRPAQRIISSQICTGPWMRNAGEDLRILPSQERRWVALVLLVIIEEIHWGCF